MADDIDMSATDYVGAIQRNLSDMLHYLQQPAMSLDIDMCRGHLTHIDTLCEKVQQRQAEVYARHAATNGNGSEASAAPPQ